MYGSTIIGSLVENNIINILKTILEDNSYVSLYENVQTNQRFIFHNSDFPRPCS